MSLGLNMECIADCPVIPATDPVTSVNVKGFHSDGTNCIADVPATTPTTNNACVPVKDGFSVNVTKQTCVADCATTAVGSHKMNG